MWVDSWYFYTLLIHILQRLQFRCFEAFDWPIKRILLIFICSILLINFTNINFTKNFINRSIKESFKICSIKWKPELYKVSPKITYISINPYFHKSFYLHIKKCDVIKFMMWISCNMLLIFIKCLIYLLKFFLIICVLTLIVLTFLPRFRWKNIKTIK